MPDLSSTNARDGIMSPNHAVLKVLLFSLAGAAGRGDFHLNRNKQC